jgi:sulfatase-like protein
MFGSGNHKSNSFREQLPDVSVCAIVAFLFAVAFKLRLLTPRGFEVVASHIPGGRLSFFQKALLFSGETWESFVLLPLLLLGIGLFVHGWWKKVIYLLVVEVELFFAFVHWATYEYIFEFPSKSLALDFVGTLHSNPDFLVGGLLTKRARIVLVITLLWGMVSLVSFKVKPAGKLWRGSRLGFAAVMIPALALSGLMPASNSTFAYYQMGPARRILTELLRPDPVDTAFTSATALASRNPLEIYRATIFPEGPPQSPSTSHFSKPAVPPNVIFIVWETANYKDYPIPGPVSRRPNLARLIPHSLVASQHYSTDVESIRAHFTLFSSIYELPGRGWSQYFVKRLEGSANARRLDSLPRLLADAGYATRYYFPASLWPEQYEEEQLRRLGFQSIRLATSASLNWGDTKTRVAAEKSMYRMAVGDIQQFHSAGQPFMAAIVPSLGHFPLVDVRPPEGIAHDSPPDRSALLGGVADFQDQMLGTLIQALADLKILDNTILVITGDHGPRTRLDDPDLNLPYIGEENFHVPLLIHYPRAFEKPVVMQRLTSHVDVVPTVLDLMGIDRTELLQQGLSMFDDVIDRRITFFLGEHLLSATALHYRGKFFMFDRRTHGVYSSGHFTFNAADAVRNPESEAESKSLLAAFNSFKRVQEAWVLNFRGQATSTPAANAIR